MPSLQTLFCLFTILGICNLFAIDSDKDGLPDNLELNWGLPHKVPNITEIVYTAEPFSDADRKKPSYDPACELKTISACHVAGNRFLWKGSFLAPVKIEQLVLHLYIDADSNLNTGRKATGNTVNGTDYMCSAATGSQRCQKYTADGKAQQTNDVKIFASDNDVYILTDIDVAQADGFASFQVYFMCHSKPDDAQKAGMNKNSKVKVPVKIKLIPGEKLPRLADSREPYKMRRSYGIDMIRQQLYATPGVVSVPFDKLTLDNYVINLFTQSQFGHVYATKFNASVSAPAPKGRFHPGFLVYDTKDGNALSLSIDNEIKGFAPINIGNRRFWFYWLEEAIEFKGGETVKLTAEGSGRHPVCAMVFFPNPPPLKELPYNIHHLCSYSAPQTSGHVSISYLTEMPSTSLFEYGIGDAFDLKAEDNFSTLVHKIELAGLNPDKEYKGRAVAFKPDGSRYESAPITFRPLPKPFPRGTVDKASIPLTVTNPHNVAAKHASVTTGIPFPQGAVSGSPALRLLNGTKEIPLQYKVTAWWQDNSAKWILLDFQADVPARATAAFNLEYGRNVSAAKPGPSLADTAKSRIDKQGNLVMNNGKPCEIVVSLVKYPQTKWEDKAEVTVEEDGHIRTTIKAKRNLLSSDGKPLMAFETRYSFAPNSPAVKIRQTFTILEGNPFLEVKSMEYRIPGVSCSYPVPYYQRTDDEIVAGGKVSKGRMDGTVMTQEAAVGVRDFWQNYPKGFSSANGLAIQICPPFEKGFYDKFPFEKEGHHLYYYLLDGCYKFKKDCAKTHEMVIAQTGDGDAQKSALALNQRRLLAVAPPEWYCASNAFYPVAVRDPANFKIYEDSVDMIYKDKYAKERERWHDYGMLNFGDWFPERGANWGNSEYDTQLAHFLQFIRSGNTDAFFFGEEMETHNRDVDTPAGTGAVLIHQMGHVGGYYNKSVPGTLGIPKGGSSISHAWSEGHFLHYFLTGDIRSWETANRVSTYFIQKEFQNPYDFTSLRVPGWHLIMNSAALASTNSPYYLNASRIIIDRVLELQDKIPRPMPEHQAAPGREFQVGGWSRMMVPGHCHCEPRHRGNANFMIAVLLAGMKYYQDVTGDPLVKDSIIKGAKYLVTECYSKDVMGFRYTSCPNMRYSRGTSPLMVEGIARAYLWTKDPMLLSPLTDALRSTITPPPYGKSFSMYYRMAPRVLADLAAAGIQWNTQIQPPPVAQFKPPAWFKDAVIIQAENFTAEGLGNVKVADDRAAIMGKIITAWDAVKNHWIQWDFDAPEDGEYEVIFRYGTPRTKTLRNFEIDGKIPSEAAKSIYFPTTGGFGHAAEDWKYLTLSHKNGKPATITLKKGRHTIKMTNLNNGIAMDFIALKPINK